MFKKILIIGCGLIGSSILRAIHRNKLSKKTFVLEKSKTNVSKIKKIKSNCKLIKSINSEISDVDLVIIEERPAIALQIIEQLKTTNPSTSTLAISPHGLKGPYANRQEAEKKENPLQVKLNNLDWNDQSFLRW